MPGAWQEALRSVSLIADSSIGVYTGPPGMPGSASPNAGYQYCAVKITGDTQVGLCTAGTDYVIGILQNKPQYTGEPATVGIRGISNAIAGAAITAGQFLVPNATGQLVPSGSGGTTVTPLLAVTAAPASGDMFAVHIR